MTKKPDWEALEKRVRTIASYLWDCPARAEQLHGVRCDAVLKPEPDHWILLEVSKNSTLDKLRTDLAKFAAVKPALMAEGIYAKCYFVCLNPPSENLITTGKGNHVNVLSHDELEKQFFDYERYHFVRSDKRFGSAVDPISGEKDQLPYVEVSYEGTFRRKLYTLSELRKLILNGSNVILLGNYGTGKSRCVQELFRESAAPESARHVYPLAIDLRENWGLRRGAEVVRRHFYDLGLSGSADAVVKVLDKGSVRLFLDGFDEIASQVWSDDPIHLKAIRAASLAGVKDLIGAVSRGILITGREHYFNSDEEMFECLGLSSDKTIVVRCADEFSEEQMEEYLHAVSQDLTIPRWLPRRPLVSKMLLSLEREDLQALLDEQGGETRFWHKFLDAICVREARIHPSLVPDTIRAVLLEIAHITRTKSGAVGPISLTEMNDAFERVVGRPPRDEASAMLQRLPILGRVDAETSDRQFLDTYILDGLRATALIESLTLGNTTELLHEKWRNPLDAFGRSLLAENIVSSGSASHYFRLLTQANEATNKIVAGDLITALLATDIGQIDFENIHVKDFHLGILDLADTKAKNLHLEDCIIEELRVSPKRPENITVRRCLLGTLRGLSRSDDLPGWIAETTIEHFDALTNVARIREANLSREQQIFVTIVQKTFFQPGGGRKEEALLRGLGRTADQKAAKQILGTLLKNGILDKFPGDSGIVYTPVRKHTRRMAKIISYLHHSTDPLWVRL